MTQRILAAFQSLVQLVQFHPQWRSAMPHDRKQEQLMFGFWLLWLVQVAWTQPTVSSIGYALDFWRWLLVVFVAFAGGVVLLYLLALVVGKVRYFPVLFDGHVMGLFLSGVGFTLATLLGVLVTPEGSQGIWLSHGFIVVAGAWTLVVMTFVVRTSLRLKTPLSLAIAGCYLACISVLEWLAQVSLHNLETNYWPF